MNRSILLGLLVALAGASGAFGCATTPPGTSPDEHVVATKEDAIEFSSAALQREGYGALRLDRAEQVRPNYWRIRFGLAPRGSGRFLDVYFDGARRTVVEKVEVAEP